jgi:PIN domain nuclease of toxin-antitoxin system
LQKRQAIRPLVDELGCRLPRRVISLAEIAIKQTIGKLDTREEYVLAGIRDLKLRVLPWSAVHASKLFGLPPHHRDPFDRQIIAQALAERLPVVTPDEKFRLYKGIEVIW